MKNNQSVKLINMILNEDREIDLFFCVFRNMTMFNA